MPNEREPLVIDKETTFRVRYGTKTGVLILNPICGMTDCILLLDCTGHVGSMRIEPDPAAEAVDRARERSLSQTRQHIEDELNKFMLMPSVVAEVVAGVMGRLAAIDTPPEPVSDFQRGAVAMRAVLEADFEAFLHNWSHRTSTEFEDEIRRVICKAAEPTDAH